MGLMWAPLIHLQPEIGGFASTGEAADWASKSPAGLRVIRYLRVSSKNIYTQFQRV